MPQDPDNTHGAHQAPLSLSDPLRPSDPTDPSKWVAKYFQALGSIGEEALELIVALWVLIMVERATGHQGLGIYAYLAACFYAVRYLANYGVSRYIEREAALVDDPTAERLLIHRGMQATLITSLAGAALLLVSAGFDAAHTQVQERIAAYIIMAILLPLSNHNHLILSILSGKGDHGRVAGLRMVRQGIFLAAMFILTRVGVLPSYLLIAYLPAELVLHLRLRQRIEFPHLKTVFKEPAWTLQTLKKGQAYLFTDNAVDLLINIDLFVLGLFLSATELGIYAEAAVLLRFFLIVPVGLRPILRRIYGIMTARQQSARMAYQLRRNTALLFSLHAALALVILLYFPAVIEFFFDTRQAAAQAFQIFVIFIPGLIFYGPFSAQEPVYEALDRALDLKRLTMTVATINLCLTFYLVPAAGTFGAAAATMLTMVCHAALFGRRLNRVPSLDKSTFIVGGLGLYLLYVTLKWLAWPAAVTILAGPALIGILFYACGIFGVQPDQSRP